MENNTSQPFNEHPFYKRRSFIYLAIACTALLVTGIAAMFHKNYPGVKLKNLAAELIHHDLPPGGHKAILTLANGKVIVLNEAADGKLGEEGGLVFRKIGHGQLLYEGNKEQENGYDAFHSISTPKGGTYQITLPDGTKVWLNAASTLKFPVDLNNRKEREVQVSGEAYLQVSKDSKHPFSVLSNQQLVKVLGADFNICDYAEDQIAKTTLTKGSVHLSTVATGGTPINELTLKISKQAVVEKGEIIVLPGDTTEAMAWKNGFFAFNNEPLKSVMNKISRWYDVDVSYEQFDNSPLFSGKVSRYEHLSKVLKLLELSGGIHFTIEEGKIIVKKKRE